ncbi:heavy-metal-associated domain-containing protein [Roseospira marina]|uniref:Heavy-metal-associated domain-containing protein n=1 Tax=Roseospira marina TaxID=140057 RepID=A0A5M6IBA9_9PROT|nr:heavy metal-associated domain-containing protein [Roseospira marina]KAA5605590.1 heavy-metal-associated domain-containing protein [Roseospira marina]MBB4313343.1 copper chaperone [Roseospira marina]MBB5085916.1 copper chaperone [Roseospira marina]
MTATYTVTGMTCGGCARSVETAIRQAAPSVESVSVDLDKNTVTVTGAVEDSVIAGAVDDAGFDFGGRAA